MASFPVFRVLSRAGPKFLASYNPARGLKTWCESVYVNFACD
jgi:hypothetical protein